MTRKEDKSEDVTVQTLAPYLAHHLPDIGALRTIEKFKTGQSNPTYKLMTDTGAFVLRAKPPGRLLPSAHAVEREFRVMGALGETTVPVPQVLHLSEDADSPIGRAFFVMQCLEGRIFWNPALPDCTAKDRAALYAAMSDTLAALHAVDVKAVGLTDFGKPNDYYTRQLNRWSKQYKVSERQPKPDIDRLIQWLGAHIPPDEQEVALVHGDYRMDNMIFAPDAPKVIGLLDWELSTLGHPMADLAYQCMQWRMSADGPLKGLGGLDRGALGLPDETSYVADYAAKRGVVVPEAWTFYLAFAFFRFAAILEGVGARADAGNASNPEMALQYGAMVPELVDQALQLIAKEG